MTNWTKGWLARALVMDDPEGLLPICRRSERSQLVWQRR
jgi:hypothetical protein